MGIALAGSTTSAGAPNIEAGIFPARFDGVSEKLVPGKFSSEVYEWAFTLLDQNGAVLYDEGDPIEVTGLTSRSFNVASKTTPRAVRYLRALMSAAEFANFSAGSPIDSDALIGRLCQTLIAINDNGWPKVDDVIAAPKASGKNQPGAKISPIRATASV